MKAFISSKFLLIGSILLGLIYFMIGFPNIFRFENGVSTYALRDVMVIYIGAFLPLLLLVIGRLVLRRFLQKSDSFKILSKGEAWILVIYLGLIIIGGFFQTRNRLSMQDVEKRIQESSELESTSHKGNFSITNNAGEEISKAIVTVCGQTVELKDIQIGKSASGSYQVKSDSHYTVQIEFKSGKKVSGEVGYVTNGMDFQDAILVTASGVELAGEKKGQ